MTHEQNDQVNLNAAESEDLTDAPLYEITDADELAWATSSEPWIPSNAPQMPIIGGV